MNKNFVFNIVALCMFASFTQVEAAVPYISDEVWRTISNSDAYRNFPKPRATAVSFQAHNVSSGKHGGGEYDELTSIVSTPEEGCLKQDRSTVLAAPPNLTIFTSYTCLGYILTSYDKFRKLKNVDITGSLFPMDIGAAMSFQATSEIVFENVINNTKIVQIQLDSTQCKVMSQGEARELDSRLTGVAWQVLCDSQSNTSQGNGISRQTDYFLEDIGVFLSQIGVPDFITSDGSYGVEVRYVLPTAGSISKIQGAPNSGFVITTRYSNYEWEVTK